ncbi:hypothetical protein IQ22_02320 [Pseudomonas duriflava]|uniref:Uncharacterized protein n=1 Tax=Pseudomonas duriflava TaxID=459528 RepID=A0A562QAC6_9PSED|nr:hypothetical protein [Pseudomonas duriflava]TWI53715.1 hypothetical protein IQ22_02320 [Pseudomonas duriflava]
MTSHSLLNGTGFLLMLKRLVSKRTFDDIDRQLEQLGTEFPLFDHPPLTADYPGAESLEPLGIRAYQMQIMSCNQDKMTLGATLMKLGFTPTSSTPEITSYSNAKGEKLMLRMQTECNGTLFNLVTDSMELLIELDQCRIAPPAPWQAFPALDVKGLAALQGETAFWWSQYWTPYWSRLDKDERELYLNTNRATPDWKTFIEAHL